MVFITRNYSAVGKLYETSNLLRFRKARRLFNYYITTGRLSPETNEINYDYFMHNIYMVSAFWTTQEKIFTSANHLEKPINMVEMCWYMLQPYLTEKGKTEYYQINEVLELKTKLTNAIIFLSTTKFLNQII